MGAFLVNRFSRALAASLGICCLLVISSSAQVKFEKRLGGSDFQDAYSVKQTRDGGYAVGGWNDYLSAGGHDAYLIKTDSLGDILWDTTFGGAGHDQANSVCQTSDGGYALAGCTESYGAGGGDLYLIKTDSLGHTVWEITCGGPERDEGHSVQETSDGCLVVAGVTFSFGAGDADVYLVKTDSMGSILWERTYGGDSSDVGESVQKTMDGGYIIAGTTRSFGAGDYDVYLVKTDSLGNLLWDAAQGGSSRDDGMSVQQTQDGGYIIAGHTWSFGAGWVDVYLVRTDSLGNTLWDAAYGGAGDDKGESVDKTLGGGYIIVGTTESFTADESDVYLVRTDSLGDTLWTRTFDGMDGLVDGDEGRSVQQTSDGGYIIAAYTGDLVEGDVYLVKTDENGLTGVEESGSETGLPISNIRVFQNSPSPFHHSTSISYSLPVTTEVTLAIYDITGRLVETLVNETQQPGIHQVRWNRSDNPSGVYFYRLKAGEFVETRKMVVVE